MKDHISDFSKRILNANEAIEESEKQRKQRKHAAMRKVLDDIKQSVEELYERDVTGHEEDVELAARMIDFIVQRIDEGE